MIFKLAQLRDLCPNALNALRVKWLDVNDRWYPQCGRLVDHKLLSVIAA